MKEIDVLKTLQAEFETYQVPCILRRPEEDTKVQIPILTTLHRPMGKSLEEVMGEYYFFPVSVEESEGYYFTLMLTISEELTAETYTIFSAASSILNFYLPFGAFVLNQKTKVLAFKHTIVIPAAYETEKAYELVDKVVGGALDIVEHYIDILEDMEKGKATFEDFMEIFSEPDLGESEF